MKAFWFIVLLLSVQGWSYTLEQLVEIALQQKHSLKALNYRVSAYQYEKKVAASLRNPDVMLAINDIQFDDITDRSIEAMQTNAVIFTQPLPSYGERDAAVDLVTLEQQMSQLTLEEAKATLVAQIKKTAFTIWAYEQKLAINKHVLDLTHETIALNETFSRTNQRRQLGVMNAQLMESQLLIEQQQLQQRIEEMYALLSYLVNEPVHSIDAMQLTMPTRYAVTPVEILDDYQLQRSKTKIHRDQREVERMAAKENPSTLLQVGYYQREAYKDFASVAVGINIPLYGRETAQKERARMVAMQSQEQYDDQVQQRKAQVEALNTKQREAYESYQILQTRSKAQINHMINMNIAALQEGSDLVDTLLLLQQQLSLDQKGIEMIDQYHKAQADIDAIRGVIQ